MLRSCDLHRGGQDQPKEPSRSTDITLTTEGSHVSDPIAPTRIHGHIFKENEHPLPVEFKPPEADESLNNASELAHCLSLLQTICSSDEILEPATTKESQTTDKDTNEQERLGTMTTEFIRGFKGDEQRDSKAIFDGMHLSPVPTKDTFHDLLKELTSGIERSGQLNVDHLEGLAQLIHGARPGYLDAEDLIKILDILRKRLIYAHQQSTRQMHQTTLAVSNILDVMADIKITDLNHAVGREPDIGSCLIWRSLVHDNSLLQFLKDRVQQEPLFKEQLLAYIEYSKKDKKWRTAAANAMTILVRAGVQFNSADLQGIRIPGADLSYGVFDSANMQDADLRKVNFRGAWLRRTDLSRAQVANAQFGESPFHSEDSKVRSCAYSPDGNYFAVGLDTGCVHIYTASNWERTQILSGHYDYVECVVYSPRGHQIATASYDMTVRLWDPETGSLQCILTGHTHWVQGIAYSPQGDQIASTSNDGTIRFWDVATGDCLHSIVCDDGEALCVAYSPKGQKIASGHIDCEVRLWDVGARDFTHVLSGHNNTVWAVAYSPQGDQVASASEDSSVRIWDVETGACNHILTGYYGPVYSVVYSPNGDQIATGGVEQTVRLWDVETGLCLHSWNGHGNSVLQVVYAPKGDRLASASLDKTVRLWDILTRSSHSTTHGHSSEVDSVKYSPRGDQFASGSLDNTIRLWDVEKGSYHRILRGHTSTIFGLAYSPQGDQIVSGSHDEMVRLWDIETGACLHVLEQHRGSVQSVAFSPQGDRVASAGDDMTICLWNTATGDWLDTLRGHTDGVRGVVFSPNGNHIASGSQDATVRIWDAETGECCQILIGHTNWVRNVTYSPQGNELASAGYDKTIRLWDMETGESRLTLTGHSDRVKAIAYSKQGHLIASGSWDNTIRLWDVATGQCRAEIQSLPSVIHDIDWGMISDADYLMAGIGDGSILMWKVIQDEDACHVRLHWSATSGTLTLTEALVQDARGLSPLNEQLLKQRGAIGEPVSQVRGIDPKMSTVVSVASEIKQSSDEAAMDSLVSNLSIDQPVQPVEQADGQEHT